MGRKATNMLAFNDQAIRKVIKEAKDRKEGEDRKKKEDRKEQAQREYRIEGLSRLALVVQPTGTATFFVFYTAPDGKRQKLKLGQYHPDNYTLREARGAATDALALINRGADPVAEAEGKAKSLTFRQLAEQFLTEARHLATTTRRNYRQYLEKDVYPVIGAKPASDVTGDHIVGICKTIEATGASVQSQSTKTAIGGVFKWGVRERLVKANPCTGLGRRSALVARSRTPKDDELAALWKAIEGVASTVSPTMRLILKLAILTGQRRTEVAGARISELQGLDTEQPVWTIPGDVNIKRGKIIEGRTKNGREQHVPLSTQAAELFREAIELSKGSEFVFPADLSKVKVGKTPRMFHTHGGSVTSAMRRLREAAGIEDISIHDMRRAVTNWLKNEGVSREVRDLILNHIDPSVTEAHYSQNARMEKQVRSALQAWADHVWEITGQGAPANNVVQLRA